ncbi:trehalose 6-phosphate phosphatase [Thermomonas carbonis]|nr:trehalose 6-phosphate phosphatase [Thermomonas carbonis]
MFLDVDGCLLEFADAPDKVIVPLGLRERLHALSEQLDGALALVSGRSLEALDDLFWPLRLPAAGLHGLERRSRNVEHRAPIASQLLRRLCAEAETLAIDHRGAMVENKRAGFALHWRAAPQAEHAMRAFAESALSQLVGYRLQHGDRVVELLPVGGDKGGAIAAFLEEAPFAGRHPVFAGDDLTDESGFRVINARAGTSVLVGKRPDSAATFGLLDPADVRAWLGMPGTDHDDGDPAR